MKLYNLETGLKELGATRYEVKLHRKFKIKPKAQPTIVNKERCKRFYTLGQCRQCLKAIRNTIANATDIIELVRGE